MTSQSYGADDIVALEGLEAVRKRPGMYIGSTDSRGVAHCLFEITDNSTDEAAGGHGTRIEVVLHPDGSVEVSDEGRGIPTGINAKTKKSATLMALSMLHAGGKFSSKAYGSSGGLHGVGSAVVNGLSKRMDATIKQNGQIHRLSFQYGKPGTYDAPGPNAKFTPGGDLEVVGKMKKGDTTGTSIRYWLDTAYFETGSTLDLDTVRAKLRNSAFLVPGVTYVLRDLTTGDLNHVEEFHYPHGLTDMVDYLTPSADKPVCDTLVVHGEGHYKENAADENGVMQSNVERTMEVEIALRWGTGYDTTIECFTNTIRNVHGGTHRKGFERGMNRALTEAIKNARGLLKAKDEAPVLDDMLEGLTAVIHVRVPEPQFTSQTKDELSTAGVTKAVQGLVEQTIKSWVDGKKTKTEARVVLGKIVDASRVRLTQKQQKETARRKTALEGASMPAKLVDCRSTGVDRSEIFIVEGDSALGCFTGDTLVATVEGRPLSFNDLVEDWANGVVHFGYASTPDGAIEVVPLVEPRRTKTVQSLVEVSLDNGEVIRCTPDHLFMLRDGTFERADNLASGLSLMPLYRRVSSKAEGHRLNGYEQVHTNISDGAWHYTHHLSDQWNLSTGRDAVASSADVRHHVDFDKRNNHPDNLRRMHRMDHIRYHAAHLNENRERVLAGFYLYLDNGGREMYRENLLKQWEDPDFRVLVSETARRQMADPGYKAALQEALRTWLDNGGREIKSEATKVQWLTTDLRAIVRASNQRMFADPEFRARFAAGLRRWLDEGGREFLSEKLKGQWDDPAFRELCSALSAARHRDPAFRKAIHGGFQRWYNALTVEEKAEYAERMRASQAAYWASEEAREEARERTLRFFEDPERRAEWSDRSKSQWADDALRAWRSNKTVEQFSDESERERQRQAVLDWHREHPEFGEGHSTLMKERMSDPALVAKVQAGRAAYVDSVPRGVRVAKQIEGRRIKALARLATLLDATDADLKTTYEAHRLATARTGMKFDRLLADFDGDVARLREAAATINHKVVSVHPVREVSDVYDLTVEGLHNFALESGVFVHNSARTGRVSEYQALLPIRGKILNVQKASLGDALKNAEIAALIQCLGAGSGRSFDIEQMRYGRVIIMADADSDGSHIRCLLITLFFRYMRPVIEHGRLYAAMPPLFKVTTKGRNPETFHVPTQVELDRLLARLKGEGRDWATPIPRFKGLGEMNAEELWETTMDPSRRSIRRITMEDAEAAEARIELAMGDKVMPRRDWIIESADQVDREAIDA